MRVKICGITKVEQGQAIAQLGATALGFICVPASPRYIKPEKIRAIVEQLPQTVDCIGVFANTTIETICQVAIQSQLTGVQLHGDESSEFCDRIKQLLPGIEIIKALRVKTFETLELASIYANHVDTLLLDAYHPHQLGGTGKTIDWTSLQQFHPTYPWLLAGGLTPDNILDALEKLQPNGIDLSSGVEIAPGDKDLTKVTKLFHILSTIVNS
ncbi:N-(5'-phosphoribosyl)anthranilate isomerase [Oscillatoriales cyanobacterium USR001]|nr:N-(5'-phosphoribosyl)anthranilate isomerase [Oscillatoriales cyanobacterium USR001]